MPGFGMLLMCGAAMAAGDDCKPVFDAMNKVTMTPTRIFSTTTNAGKLETNEILYNGDVIYVSDKGKWSRSPATVQQVAKQDQEDRNKSKYTCRYLKDESVDGETAVVYVTHAESPDQKSDGQMSISKNNGLPLRNEIDVTPAGKKIKTHYSVKYDYKNIDPPKL